MQASATLVRDYSMAPPAFLGGLRCMDPLRTEDTTEDNADFHDALEMWADWCDRQDEAADLADGVAPRV
jgi:hypothetical protein